MNNGRDTTEMAVTAMIYHIQEKSHHSWRSTITVFPKRHTGAKFSTPFMGFQEAKV